MWIRFFVSFAVAISTGSAAQEPCGNLANAYGPFDYRTAPPNVRGIVEGYHFDADVEGLRRGLSAKLGGDIDYTLRALPNHPRALVSMMKLAEREKNERPAGAKYTISCYFDRALRWTPNDPSVHTLAGLFYLKNGKKDEAIRHLEEARRLSGDSPNVNYNLGLVYFELKDYDKALDAAHRAYQGGFELPGLREKLKAVGKWTPTPARERVNEDPANAPKASDQPG